MNRYDFVVIGAGASGATLATRLAQRTTGRVLLLEAGEPHERDFWVRVPIGVGKVVYNPDYVWKYQTEPQQHLGGRRLNWITGRMPGGSSSVNGMVYVRGDPAEFDHWAELGNQGWDYASVLPYFKRLEAASFGDEDYRGRHGPIEVSSVGKIAPNPLSDAFMSACEEAGVSRTEDCNGEGYEGVDHVQLASGHGQRSSTALCYLHKLSPPNLHVVTSARVTRILFEQNRATGVEYLRGGQRERAMAAREVILSAGSIRSPQLLELSGIGDGERLRELGLDVRAHLPGVGENLIDHLQARISYRCTQRVTLNEIVASPWRKALMGAQYLLTKRGYMATSTCFVQALARTGAGSARPSAKIQIQHVSGTGRLAAAGFKQDSLPGFNVGFFQLGPKSRGCLHVQSADPTDPPSINPCYLSDEEDRTVMLDAFRLSRKIIQQSSMYEFTGGETTPGEAVQDDDEVLEYIRQTGETGWHPVGTCRMGDDPMAVVDNELRVRGIERLRVVDASVMPTMCTPNTYATSVMIGEKAADLILVKP